jgi:hypothetical protein
VATTKCLRRYSNLKKKQTNVIIIIFNVKKLPHLFKPIEICNSSENDRKRL